MNGPASVPFLVLALFALTALCDPPCVVLTSRFDLPAFLAYLNETGLPFPNAAEVLNCSGRPNATHATPLSAQPLCVVAPCRANATRVAVLPDSWEDLYRILQLIESKDGDQ